MFQKSTIIFPHSNPIKMIDKKGREYYIEQGGDLKLHKEWNNWIRYCEKHNLNHNGTKKVVVASE